MRILAPAVRIVLTVAAFSAMAVAVMDGTSMEGTDSDIHVDGASISWMRRSGDASCKAYGSVETGILTGEMDCGHARVAYTLKKRAP